MLRRRRHRQVLCLAVMAGLIWNVGCQKELPAPADSSEIAARQTTASDSRVTVSKLRFETAAQPSHSYVGSKACASCHADVHAEYHSHPMATSMAPAAEAMDLPLLTDTSFEPFPAVSYEVTVDKTGQMVHSEQRVDGTEVLYDHSVRVDYRVGSGVHGFSYLLDAGGLLFQSPLSWYRTNQRWDMSPGYNLPTNPGFERLVTHNCVACHSGIAHPLPDSRLRFREEPFSEMSIGCESCHGPGRDHVDFQNSQSVDESSDPILDLSSLTAELQNAVCFQCHLQGKRRVPKVGRSEFDFRPGMTMSDVWTVFLKNSNTENDAVVVVSHAEQMFESQCYTQSSNSLMCVTCHDPHRRPEQGEAVNWYRSRCFTCHTESEQSDCIINVAERMKTQPDDSCVACHMPEADLESVPHTAHTDHRIRRSSDAVRTIEQSKNDILVEADSDLSKAELQRARGILLAEEASGTNNQTTASEALQMLVPVLEAIPNDPLACEAAGRAATVLGMPEKAIAYWNQGLQKYPRDVILLLLKAGEQHNLREFSAAATTYQQLIQADPHRALYHGRQAHVLGMLGQFDESVAAAEQALKRNPSLQQAHAWLARLFQQQGNTQKAEYHSKLAKQLQNSFRESMKAMPQQ